MKRIAATLVAALSLLSAVACRPRVEPVAVTPRVVPEPAEIRVQACWVESGARLGFTASAILVRHPKGNILIDAGNSSDFDDEIDVYSGSDKTWLAVFPGSLKPKQPIDELLRADGVDPDGLQFILPTHAHLDHLGGAVDLPSTPVLMTDEEAQLVQRGTESVTFEVIPAHAESVAPRMERLAFVDEPYEIFDRHADLFGDGSVVAVPLPGHTPGSIGVFVTLSDGTRVFHLGDAVNDREQIEDLRGRKPAMLRTDMDRPAAERVVARLHMLHDQAPDIVLLPAHERKAWEDAFGQPGC